ncbi:PREDICTED: uncharacterized protein LOC104594737 isoform X2 [Nelumbo nucifera]|uniref:Uncharacterized protein LOC104594737 isoform X2 n=2 Tax=Nelumbo nucifera TaxID=4432 RepID=A0A1U7ZWL3_NELNU|nr:PREDICTED: uncharacterized protein LOC104594737 isoform X2 [Nelumbo nucifera]
MSDEGEKTCPLCTEEMDLTDQQLKPCKCGYEICVWCWHHIMDMAEKDDTEGRCPACRTPYDKEKIVGMAANCERLVAEINSERKQKSLKAKPKTSEGRKHLSSVRVIQRNLVYIIGIPSNLADEDVLQHKEYFGQYGKVLKVSISRTSGGAIQHSANNTCSVYITYSKEEEAIRCIQSVHGFVLEGRSLRACFGTTKYCHAWLRNVPCSNPDCLYLHDIGTQEDSFTKDEIISAYTRVQQITGATYNLQRRSGNVLPPPADEYCNSSSGKPIVKSASNNPVSQVKGSPPNSSSGRSVALPAAASWGMRASNCRPIASNLVSSNGPTKQKTDTCNDSVVLPSSVTSTSLTSTLPTDVGKVSTVTEDFTHHSGRSGSLDLSKPYIVRECHKTAVDAPAHPELVQGAALTLVTYNHLSSLPESKAKDGNIMTLPNSVYSDLHRQSCGSVPNKEETDTANGSIQDLCSELSAVSVDRHSRVDHSEPIRSSGLDDNHLVVISPRSQRLHSQNSDKLGEQLTSLPSMKVATPSDRICDSGESCDWRSDSQAQTLQNSCFEAEEEDFLPFDDQRVKASEEVSHPSYLPRGRNSPSILNDSSSQYSWQHGDSGSASNLNNIDSREHITTNEEAYVPFKSDESVLSNGHSENDMRSSTEMDGFFDHSNLFSSMEKGKSMARFNDDIAKAEENATLDMGESSIISNILSMEFDVWDDSLTSPHNLAKLLNESDKQQGSLKISGSWKVQNSNQSRFSFARQDEFANEGAGIEPSFSSVPNKYSLSQDSLESRDNFLEKLRNGFSSSTLEEPDPYSSIHSIFSSNKLSVSRAQVSAPPGFSVASRAPPPGFSSHERMDQDFDTSGNHLLESSLLRNQYQGLPTGNIGGIGDVEFIDPAILAVGKGRLPNGLGNSGLDMRSTFPSQLGVSDDDARLQLLMQQSISAHQNMRFADHNNADMFSPFSDAYSIPSRLLEQSQVSSMSPYAQLSLQQSRNTRMSNGHWDGWNDVQTGNDLGMAELLRNERLGFNKFFPGYNDLKFRMPSYSDLYNRAFGM